MDSSRRAVESYWRSRMIDGATSDDDKVAAVYKLEEICELLRSSHVSIVKEVSEFIFKRLEQKSPVVKQKALRVIKYAVSKSGSEFRREMQRNSAAIRQLVHYKGQPDPLKGDALNKAVREIAQEVLSAIFSEEDNNSKPTTAESLNKRIQGFGNTNFEMPSPSEDKKSFLSEVVGIGSATIKQGLSSLTQSQSMRKNDTGTYRSPNLRRSLTRESNAPDSYEQSEYHSETNTAPRYSESSRSWGQDLAKTSQETSNGVTHPSPVEKSREERLLETIVTSGGVRLQPTRDALHVFLLEAAKLDALVLCRALLSKLQSPLWQVRMKAVCVVEAILRKKDDELSIITASYLEDNRDAIVACSESPQASLREKANKVLSLLGGEQNNGGVYHQEKKTENSPVQMPDLIDTGAFDDYSGTEDLLTVQNEVHDYHEKKSTAPVLDDLFGGDDADSSYQTSSEQKTNADPFSDVAFHTNDNNNETVGDIFEGMSVGKHGVEKVQLPLATAKEDPFDIFGSSSDYPVTQFNGHSDASELMSGLSINGNTQQIQRQGTTTPEALSQTIFSIPTNNGGLSQSGPINANMFNMGPMGYNNMPPGLMFNPAFAASQQMNYGAMGNILAQQQLLATMYNFQQLGNLQSQNSGFGHASDGGNMGGGSNSSALPDIFNPNIQHQNPTSMMNNSKKEETTKAFDFISDHLASARDPKRVV